MNVKEFNKIWANRLLPDGLLSADSRFRVEMVLAVPRREIDDTTEGYLKITYTESDGQQRVYTTTESQDALNWMVTRPPPVGSLRLGNVVSTVTRAFGIKPCAPCQMRQIRMNKIGG